MFLNGRGVDDRLCHLSKHVESTTHHMFKFLTNHSARLRSKIKIVLNNCRFVFRH